MAAKEAKRASTKVKAREHVTRKKRAVGVADLTNFRKAIAKELTLDPLERPGASVVDAARRLWLSRRSQR
jgi:hypothetical protein